MSDEVRKVFKMETILNLISDKSGADVSELLFFLTQRDLTSQEESVASTLAKAWIFSQHPPFMEARYDELMPYEEWVGKMIKQFGDNASLLSIPEADTAPVNAILDSLASSKLRIETLENQITELSATIKDLESYTAKNAELTKKNEALGKENDKFKKENQTVKAKNAELTAQFQGKLPVDENELNSTIMSMVTKALKDAIKSVPLGGGGGAGVEEAVEEAAEEAGGDSFGFGGGGGGGSDDGFGF